MRTGAAFGMLGLLVGLITGMTETSVTTSLIGLLFAFAGGSAIAFRNKLKPDDRAEAEYAILALSIGCAAGIIGGILVSEFRLLSPEHAKSGPAGTVDRAGSRPYPYGSSEKICNTTTKEQPP